MKKKLLLFLSHLNLAENTPISGTLAWLARSRNVIFDVYYDSYRQGIHFPGGDSRELAIGQLTGGTVCGDRHFEEFYRMLLHYEVAVAILKGTIFQSSAQGSNINVVTSTDRISDFYLETFRHFCAPFPENIVMVGSHFDKSLSGIEAYLYPEVYYRRALGVPDSVPEDELRSLCQGRGKIFCLYVDNAVIARLEKSEFEIEIIDQLETNDDYLSITRRIAGRWANEIKGFIIGDPTLVAHWVPRATEEDLVGVYSVPQQGIVQALAGMISTKGNVVYGRQSSDRDFFDLSKLDRCFQVIDPCRPPFQSVKHIEHNWLSNSERGGFYRPEFSDAELAQFAREGKILISLMIWSGMIREIANLYNLMDLVTMTQLKCGLVLTAPSFEYMMHPPLELLTIPWERGGVFPLVEPVLGSCGLGVGIESLMSNDRLAGDIREALARILQKVKYADLLPKGWWATLDADLERLNAAKRPKPFRFLRYPPYFQIRFDDQRRRKSAEVPGGSGRISDSGDRPWIGNLKRKLKKAGLDKYFSPYRPYEDFRAGPLREDIVKTVKSTGLEYMFTKSGFRTDPQVKYRDPEFVVLNYTSGQWDGWTPFETVNDVSDLRKSENILRRRKKPGWIVGTIDACLWTFSGEIWKRGNRLYEIAKYCAEGGRSRQLINVKPYTIARYARFIADLRNLP
jgi:hypothetical protein